jgi:hypothetical protein
MFSAQEAAANVFAGGARWGRQSVNPAEAMEAEWWRMTGTDTFRQIETEAYLPEVSGLWKRMHVVLAEVPLETSH